MKNILEYLYFATRLLNKQAKNSNHMKWKGRRQSDNVEDRRGMSSGGKTLRWRNCGAYNIIDKCFGGENVQMLTPLLEQINREKHDEEKGI
jgi:predicted metalloprotease